MTTSNRRWGALIWLGLAVLVIGLDQFTKAMATEHLNLGVSQHVMPFFNLTLMHNTGAAFSFLADASGWQRWFFAGLAVIVSASLIVWLFKLDHTDRWLACAISLVLGGALGNLYDRMLLGYVVDFIHVYYGQHNFPAFNIADSAITVGAIMIALDIFRKPSESSTS